MNYHYLVFDIETAPDPVRAFQNAEPFDPTTVKTGNIKNPELIAAKLAEAEAAHWQNVVDDACLDVGSAHIRAIGMALATPDGLMPIRLMAHLDCLPELNSKEWDKFYNDPENPIKTSHSAIVEAAEDHFELFDTEEDMINDFSEAVYGDYGESHRLIGHYIKQFDLPFIIRRCWMTGARLPLDPEYIDEKGIVDLADRWKVFRYNKLEFISLRKMQRHLGLTQKEGSGEFFHKQFLTDPEAAAKYLTGDIEGVYEVAKKLRIL